MAREDDPSVQYFAAALRRLRHERKLSLEQLGDRAGLTASEISRVERAQREPQLSTIVKLADGLGVDVGELMPD